ncbi:oligosaccharide flippase family protein [Thiothrix subterranea]|uniref:Oligosaccharide flippase family protein n=1 Tax=Thiothrix subterranea TaxID=2735563 RepID=A0AA51MSN2_9GAMM|nr:oligosaccharide flippase family protein [Thiothrix subterranea]WML87586.1 oligosaccharide flippase family protein [Thiothrix subterranea]
MSNNYTRSTLIRLFAIGLNAMGAVLLLPIVLKSLGGNDFGLWSMANAITGYLLLLDFGIAFACTRYLAIHGDDKVGWRKTLSSAMLMSLLLTAILLLAALLIQVTPIPQLIAPSNQVLNNVITILLVEVALSIPLRLYQSILRAEVRYLEIGWFETVRICLRLLGIPLILWLGGGLIPVLLYSTAVNVLFFALMLASVYWRDKTVYVHWQAVDWQHLKALFSFSKYTALNQTADFFKYRTDNLLVGVLIGIHAVAPYAIMIVIIDMLTQILMRFQGYWDTIIMRHAGEQRLASALDTVFVSLQIGLSLALLATFNTWLLGATFLTWWVGQQYASLAFPLSIFTLTLVGLAVQLATSPYFNAVSKQKTNAWLAVAEMGIKLLLLLPFSHLFAANGIIFASVLAALLTTLLRLNTLANTVSVSMRQLLPIIACKALPAVLLVTWLWGLVFLLKLAGINHWLLPAIILTLEALLLLLILKKWHLPSHPLIFTICPKLHGNAN